MEGILSVPPERNLISRGNWKHRYVVLGSRKSSNTSAPRKLSAPETFLEEDFGGVEDVFANQAEDDFLSRFSSDIRLSIYRQRTDTEPIASYPIECITSCYVGDIAHRKAFGSISKTTYSPLCPTLVVNLQFEPIISNRRRLASDSPNASSFQLYDQDEGKLTLFFRAGPKDVPPLTIWAREIQYHIRSNNSRRSSTITFGGDRVYSRASFRSVAYDLKIAEDEWEEENDGHRRIGPTTRSSEESALESQVNSSRSSDPGTERPISTLREFGHRGSVSTTQSPIDPHDMSPPTSVGADYMGCASISSSPRRETILDRAFNMNYIPASLSGPSSPYSTPPLTSVAKFEALAVDSAMSSNYKELDLDPSVMPASFFRFT